MTDATRAELQNASVRIPRLPWPPPGLEALQGRAWPVIAELAIGVVLLAIPLLLAIATPQPYYSLGAFGQSWWIPIATTSVAFIILLSASWHLSRLLRIAAAASRLGHGIGTIATVATDQSNDSGFVLQGARAFADMPPTERHKLLVMRITSAACYLAASLWIPLGLAVAILLASADVFGATGVWMLTLFPACVLLIVGSVARSVERLKLRRLHKGKATAVEAVVSEEAAEWTESLALIADDSAVASRRVVRPRSLIALAVAVVIPAVLLAIPVTAILSSAAMGPVLASIATPRFGKTLERFATADAMRDYRAPFDSSITPAAAGIAIANLSGIGRAPSPSSFLKAPAVRYEDWGKAPAGFDITSALAGGRLFMADSLKPDERAYLAESAKHPAHAEFAIAGRAVHADLAGARFNLPLPDTLTAASLPIPKFGPLRVATYMHIGKAAIEHLEGRDADAERTLREAVSLGFLIMEEGNTLIEGLIGNVLLNTAITSLEQFYRSTGRTQEADLMKAKREGAERAIEVAQIVTPDPGFSSSIAMMPAYAVNPAAVRGMRWEMFATFNSIASCISLQNVVFGAGDDYDTWLAKTRSTLVRYPSEAAMFDVSKAGFFGGKRAGGGNCISGGRMRALLQSFNN
ncbi:MAG: hypothetical protein ABIV28_08860 [Longimicrobiales bacterium]